MESDHSGHSYVHYLNTDKRLDEWVSEEVVRPATEHEARAAIMGPESSPATNGIQTRKRKRGSDVTQPSPTTRRASNTANALVNTHKEEDTPNGELIQLRELTEEEYDIQQHRKLFSKRNFDKVVFGQWQIKTWYVPACVPLSGFNPVYLDFINSNVVSSGTFRRIQ